MLPTLHAKLWETVSEFFFQIFGSYSSLSFEVRELYFFILISMPPSTNARTQIFNFCLKLFIYMSFSQHFLKINKF